MFGAATDNFHFVVTATKS